jgi:WS/DGAT/MGAT family acyltransferase
MSYAYAERLSALDATFLAIETANVHMHVGSVGIFDGKPLRTAEGGLDVERIRALSEPRLRRNPRFRQRLARIPLSGHPVWVDDPRFNLDYHMRHTSLPQPGDLRQLKRLAGRIYSQKLDPARPLWEMWLVEGLEDGRFAVITKLHHCMIDGVAGVDLLASFMQRSPDEAIDAPTGRWIPRPAPTPAGLIARELARRAALPWQALGAGIRALGSPRRALSDAGEAVEAVTEALSRGLATTSPTPLNVAVGPHRRFDWMRMDLGAVKAVKKELGGKVNDVVLAIVSGAIRRFLERRGVDPGGLDFRAMLPVDIRTPDQRGKLGNRICFLMAPLPVDEKDPARRMARVVETTRQLKASRAVRGTELVEQLSDWTSGTLFAGLSQLSSQTRSYNLVVTNVPGPQFPVYMAGAHMEEIYPLVPLFSNQALGIAVFSYDGGLYWGFHGDWDALPDLHDLVDLTQREFGKLCKIAAGGGA